jgi:hypothetical protein
MCAETMDTTKSLGGHQYAHRHCSSQCHVHNTCHHISSGMLTTPGTLSFSGDMVMIDTHMQELSTVD